MANEIRISQVPVQILNTQANPSVKVSQVPVQILNTQANPPAKVSQVPVQILTTQADPPVKVTQCCVQVLVKNIGTLSFIVCYGDNDYPTDTFDYVLLNGGDVATATFIEAGTVALVDGVGSITPSSGSSGASVILVLQLGSKIGAYEGTL